MNIAVVVDDEEPVRQLIALVLQQMDHHVLEAGSGDEALAILAELDGAPSIVMTDVILPSMGGAELVARVRERWPHVAVLFVSGCDEAALHDAGIAACEEHVLAKPFTIEQLRAALVALSH